MAQRPAARSRSRGCAVALAAAILTSTGCAGTYDAEQETGLEGPYYRQEERHLEANQSIKNY